MNPLVKYFRTLKWTPIPLGLGFALIAYQQFRHVKKREANKVLSASDPSELVAPNIYVSYFCFILSQLTYLFFSLLLLNNNFVIKHKKY